MTGRERSEEDASIILCGPPVDSMPTIHCSLRDLRKRGRFAEPVEKLIFRSVEDRVPMGHLNMPGTQKTDLG